MKRFLLATALTFFFAAPAFAQVVGTACPANALGTTQMSSDQTSIVACLREGAGFVWKAMSGGKPNCRVCLQFVDKGGSSGAGAWECTPYGGGMSSFAFDSNRFDPDGARVSFDCK